MMDGFCERRRSTITSSTGFLDLDGGKLGFTRTIEEVKVEADKACLPFEETPRMVRCGLLLHHRRVLG